MESSAVTAAAGAGVSWLGASDSTWAGNEMPVFPEGRAGRVGSRCCSFLEVFQLAGEFIENGGDFPACRGVDVLDRHPSR